MNIDFNTVYQAVEPYLTTGGIASTIIFAIVSFLKVSTSVKGFVNMFKNTNKLIEESIKKVIPETLYVKIEGVAKEEFAKMKAELINEVDKNWLQQIKANTELTQAIALALCSMKAIPDSQKEFISKLLDIKTETTEALVVELIPQTVETAKTTKQEKILIE